MTKTCANKCNFMAPFTPKTLTKTQVDGIYLCNMC